MKYLKALNCFPGVAIVLLYPTLLIVGFLIRWLFLLVSKLDLNDSINSNIFQAGYYVVYPTTTIIILTVFICLIRNLTSTVPEFWSYRKIRICGIFMVLGHFGVLSMVALIVYMSRIGAGSGLFLFPCIVWSGAWYSLGGIMFLTVAVLSIRKQGKP